MSSNYNTPFVRDEEEEETFLDTHVPADNDNYNNVVGLAETSITIDDDDDGDVRALSEPEVVQFKAQLARARKLRLTLNERFQESAFTPRGLEVFPGVGVKCAPRTWFHIKYIVSNTITGNITLYGHHLVRPVDIDRKYSRFINEKLCILFPSQVNELVATIKVRQGELGDLNNDATLDTVALEAVLDAREIVFTNKSFPVYSYMHQGLSVHTHGKRLIEETSVLVCRSMYAEEVDTSSRKVVAKQGRSLTYSECDEHRGVPDTVRRREFLGHRRHRDECRRFANRPRRVTPYTFGDICCGAGFVSQAASDKGLRIKWAVDIWDVACQSMALNFPRYPTGPKVFLMGVTEFLQKTKLNKEFNPDGTVDVIHFSGPCQGHSRANRGQNPERDAVNNAVTYALEEIVKVLRPRVVTLEQTDGILTKNEGQHYRALIHQLTSQGYSFRSKVLNALDYGVPSSRKRLIVYGACPGAKLPDFPLPMYGYKAGLKPPVTVNQALAPIPRNATFHNVEELERRHRTQPRNYAAAPGNLPLRQIIKCNGVEALHPNGRRWFTLREQMALQTAPVDFELSGRNQGDYTRQIGNAVPVKMYAAIIEEVVKSLKTDDKEDEEWDRTIIEVKD